MFHLVEMSILEILGDRAVKLLASSDFSDFGSMKAQCSRCHGVLSNHRLALTGVQCAGPAWPAESL